MRKTTVLGIAAALIMAPTLALSVGSDETSSTSMERTSSDPVTEAPPTPEPSDAAFELGAGTGSPEPPEAIERDDASADHTRWVESIWTSP